MDRDSACFAYKQLAVRHNIHNSRMISTKHQHQRSNSFQDSTVLSIRFEVVNCISVHEDAKLV